MSTIVEIQDSELVDISSNEWNELAREAHSYGSQIGEATLSWLTRYLTERNFPVNPDTGMPDVNHDILMHAAAVTSIWQWDARGFRELLGPHLLSLEDAVSGFGNRMNAVNQNRDSGEGASLWKEVIAFERQRRIPGSHRAITPDTSVAMAAVPPNDAGLEAIAKLLLDFSHLLCTSKST
jgi:hypothetical protein